MARTTPARARAPTTPTRPMARIAPARGTVRIAPARSRSWLHLPGRALHGADDAVVRGAAAEVPVQRLLDLGLRWSRVPVEQGLGRHDHAVAAEAALAGLLGDERALEGLELLDRPQALDCRDLALDRRRGRRDARPRGAAVDEDRARPALSQAAAELRAVQLEIVAQDVEQRGIRIHRDGSGAAVHPQGIRGHALIASAPAGEAVGPVRGP